jgi:hypothetical protein
MSETQRNALAAWVTKHSASLPQTQLHHQIRAQQLRKTAGMLEKFYQSSTPPDQLAPSFIKEAWKPSADKHFPYAFRNDHEPAMVVSKVKEYFRSKLVTMDDAVFHMNAVRVQIERQEDLAQYASEAQTKIPELMNKLNTLFGQPEFQNVLVRDITDQYKGEARFRTHQLDDPRAWERDTKSGHSPTQPS